MSLIRAWLLQVAAAALVVAVAQALTPEGAIKKIVRLAGGMVLLLAVVRPVLGLEGGSLPALTFPAEAAETVSGGEEVLKTLIAQEAGAYIVDKGSSLGCLITGVEVTAAEDGSGWPVPWSVRLTGTWTEEQKRALTREVETGLGIPPDRQSYREEGT